MRAQILKFCLHAFIVGIILQATTSILQSTPCDGSLTAISEHKNRMIAKFSERFKIDFHPSELKVFESDEAPYNGISTTSLVLSNKGIPIAESHHQVAGDAMRFDIDVNPRYHRLGVYGFMMNEALARTSGIRIFPSFLNYGYSDNLRQIGRAFDRDINEYLRILKPRVLLGLKASERADLHRRILSAVSQSSASRARATNGFHTISDIVLSPSRNPENNQALIIYRRGPKIEWSQTHVFLEPYKNFVVGLLDPSLRQISRQIGHPRFKIKSLFELGANGAFLPAADDVKNRFRFLHKVLPGGVLDDKMDLALYGKQGRDAYFRRQFVF